MKKYIFYAVILTLMTNCSNELFAQSTTDKFEALNDYLKTVDGFSEKRIIVIKEKISANMSLYLLKVNDICSVDPHGKRKEDKTLYNENDWTIMKKKYENPHLIENNGALEDKYWTGKDFSNKEIIFISVKGRSWDIAFKDYYSGDSSKYEVYSFSEPVYYKKNKYLVFTISRGGVIGGVGGTTLIVFMQKRKGKWVRTHEGYPDWRS